MLPDLWLHAADSICYFIGRRLSFYSGPYTIPGRRFMEFAQWAADV
jgi:hypothetical protein